MRMRRAALVVSVAGVVASGASVSALALGGGGTAPGGPLSGSIRPACDGYDMSGRPVRTLCDGRSVDERSAAPRRLRDPR